MQILQKMFKLGEKPEGSTYKAVFVAAFAAFGGILYGFDTGTISGILTMPEVEVIFNDGNAFSSGKSSLITSILSAGTFVGAITAPYLSDTIGRRIGMLIGCGIFCVGITVQTAGMSIATLCVGRVIAGLGVGVISSIVPLYQSEAAPTWIRGAVVCCYQWAITIGLLLAACVDYGVQNRTDSGAYRIPIALQYAWAMILFIGMFLLPETPRFRVKQDRLEDAKKSLAFLRGLPVDHPAVESELAEIRANYEYECSFGSSTFADCFKKGGSQRKRMFTGIGLQALQQLSGVNFIFYYGTSFFKNIGIANSFIITVILNVVNVVMTIPGIMFVEISGRRKLLLAGAAGMCISELVVAIVGCITNSAVGNKILLAFSCTFIASFAASWGPVAWVVVGEIYPLRVRAKAVALSSASNWLFNFGIAFATPYMVDSGPGNADLKSKVFFIWGGFAFVAFFFTYFFVYETKGLTLEQVDELYDNVTLAHLSSKFVPQAQFNDKRFVAELEKAEDENVEHKV
ncbi:uncharacterized protein V1510DRAFT_413500 [Dipodascopsis tothii]|uniref:uncharacterized protein n=1 Tax=Dipodascopsis tothii TaxID=44089 RepID=UPI0034D00F3C